MKRKVVYQDDMLVVELAPDWRDIPQLVLETIEKAGRPLTWQEIARSLGGMVGADRVMMAIRHLLAEGRLIQLPDGRLWLAGRPQHYQPRRRGGHRIIPRLYPEFF